MPSIQGRIAVVTGGNTGIGLGISQALLADGYRVAMGVHSQLTEGEAMAASLAPDGRCRAFSLDVRDPAAVSAFVKQVHQEFGLIRCLINNAGVTRHTSFLDIDDDEWRWMIETHLYGTFYFVRAVLPDMLEVGDGCIINITSELALIGRARQAHYVAAKAGVIGMTKTLAKEYGPSGIRVNSVAPGPVETKMLSDHERVSAAAELPLRRVGRPDDIGAAVAFLCSDAASWITGQVLSPNGGAVI